MNSDLILSNLSSCIITCFQTFGILQCNLLKRGFIIFGRKLTLSAIVQWWLALPLVWLAFWSTMDSEFWQKWQICQNKSQQYLIFVIFFTASDFISCSWIGDAQYYVLWAICQQQWVMISFFWATLMSPVRTNHMFMN